MSDDSHDTDGRADAGQGEEPPADAATLAERIATLERVARLQADRLDTLEDEESSRLGRRSLLKAAGLTGLVTVGAGSASADPQGEVGSASDPLRALYTESLGGGLVGGERVDDLLGSGLTTEATDAGTALAAAGSALSVSGSFGPVTDSAEELVFENNLSVSETDGVVTVDAEDDVIPQPSVSDSGSSITNSARSLDFGSGLAVSGSGSDVTVDATGAAAWGDSDGDGLLEPSDSNNTGIEKVRTVQSGGGDGLTLNIDGGTRALEIVPGTVDVADAGSSVDAPNVVAGHPNNGTGGAGPVGATVAGGEDNEASADFATVAGGGPPSSNEAGGSGGNVASGPYATVAGGESNKARAENATLAGGRRNEIVSGAYSAFLGGGFDNVVSANNAVIAGAENNRAKMPKSFIGGGDGNRTGEEDPLGFPESAAVVAGDSNTAKGSQSFIGAGTSNEITGQATTAFIGGGDSNTVKDGNGTIGGGQNNVIGDAGSDYDSSNSSHATIAGGKGNQVEFGGKYGAIGGGRRNVVQGDFATVGGGDSNEAPGTYAFVGGGGGETSDGLFYNEATGLGATVAGGQDNTASGKLATIGGGGGDTASGNFEGNKATATCATVPGGRENKASGNYSFAAGRAAKTETPESVAHDGAFVWGDSSTTAARSTAADEVRFQATGGFAVEGGPLDVEAGTVENSTGGLALGSAGGGDVTLEPAGDIDVTGNHITNIDGLFAKGANIQAGAGFVPDLQNTYDLGTKSTRWDTLYANSVNTSGGVNASGDINADGTVRADALTDNGSGQVSMGNTLDATGVQTLLQNGSGTSLPGTSSDGQVRVFDDTDAGDPGGRIQFQANGTTFTVNADAGSTYRDEVAFADSMEQEPLGPDETRCHVSGEPFETGDPMIQVVDQRTDAADVDREWSEIHAVPMSLDSGLAESARFTEYRDRVEELEATVETRDARIEDQRDRIEALESKTERLDAENERLRERNEALEARNEELEDRNEELEARLDRVEAHLGIGDATERGVADD